MFFFQIWHSHHTALAQQAESRNETGITVPLEKAILAMKVRTERRLLFWSITLYRITEPPGKKTIFPQVLRKSIVHGLRKPHDFSDVLTFLNKILENVRVVLGYSE